MISGTSAPGQILLKSALHSGLMGGGPWWPRWPLPWRRVRGRGRGKGIFAIIVFAVVAVVRARRCDGHEQEGGDATLSGSLEKATRGRGWSPLLHRGTRGSMSLHAAARESQVELPEFAL